MSATTDRFDHSPRLRDAGPLSSWRSRTRISWLAHVPPMAHRFRSSALNMAKAMTVSNVRKGGDIIRSGMEKTTPFRQATPEQMVRMLAGIWAGRDLSP